MAALVLVCAGSGFYGLSKLTDSLDFISGNAWEAADGAMESRIQIQQFILEDGKISGQMERPMTAEQRQQFDARHKEIVTTMERAFASGLFTKEEQEISGKYAQNLKAKWLVMQKEHAELAAASHKLNAELDIFLAFAEVLEKMADNLIKELEKEADKKLSWNDGLGERWAIADKAMELRIHLLARAHAHNRLNDADFDRQTAQLKSLLDELEQDAAVLLASHYLKRALPGAADKTYAQTLAEAMTAHRATFDKSVQIFQQFGASRDGYRKTCDELLHYLEKFENLGDSKVESEKINIATTKYNAYVTLGAASASGIIVAVVVAILLTRSITRPLNTAVDVSNQIAQGNVKIAGEKVQRMNIERKDEISALGKALANMVANLKQIFQNVTEVSSALDKANQDLLAMSTEQTRGIEEISASVTQTTSSVQEMNANAKQVENRAVKVTEASRASRNVSQEAQGVVEQTLKSMNNIKERVEAIATRILELSEQSQKISNITETIQDIAAQTNMLALNAAIEAARAGEHGKGFAVVATQVRELAQRSGSASREIAGLVKEIQAATNSTVMTTEQGTQGVQEGVKLVYKTAEAFQKVLTAMEQVEERAEEIRLGATQQTTATEQIAEGMSNINDVMKDTAAAAKQSQEMVNNLSDMSKKLMTAVEKFKH